MSDSCCNTSTTSDHHHAATMPTGSTNLLGGTGADDLTECVVMKGSTVSKAKAEAQGLYRDYNGERYWFCCAGCAPRFDADPTAYITA
ncbi:YHS domain-containing protein [Leifsonia sp. L25]|jgi:YHS domain-containing protein|uniref:YHS domain-containing protein n=1 Tax=Leifsonia shinshuensis TaxID=150026 RepID=A0A7G6YBU1_9MICO|nr:YHS domain-containing protein [Actinomycetota bacterium]NUU07199.1 YHS domain-containing protein [Leifsonia sp. C5G2]QNE35956.1 YHS domain-containing protein [Leifsonia shinshuensis]